jgi:hypothetical protein
MVSQAPRMFTTAIAVSVFLIGWMNGSFAATSWGWIALLCSCAVGIAVLAGELRAPRVLLAWGLAVSAFGVWASVSLLWTSDVTTGVQDVQRSLVYVAVAGLAVTFADAATPAGIRNGVLIGSCALCLYGVAAHLLPDVFGVASQASVPGRSFSPLGYWNAQGMLAVLAMILAMGVVSTDGSAFWRAVAAGVVPLLAVQMALTLSRGAELALVFGVVVWLAIDPKRVPTTGWLVVLGAGAGLAAWLANRTTAMVGDGYGLQAASAGHRLAAEILLICVATGCCAYAIARFGRLVAVPGWMRVACVGLLCAGVLLACAAAVQRYGDPARWPRSAYDTLTAAPTIRQDDPSRLSTFSLTNRNLLWSVAWREGVAHPLQGTGAGSFDEYWYRHRKAVMDSGSPHSLYLQTFAEAGLVGLLLLGITLVTPLVAAVRARRSSPLVPSLAGAVAAFLLHAGTDWDLLVPGLTVPFLLCCAALLVSRADAPRVVLASPKRLMLVAAAALLALVAGIGLIGNQQLLDSYSAANRGDFRAAEQHASDAARWQPWSYLPWMQMGNARWALGDVDGARSAYRTAASKEPGRMEPELALAEIGSGTAQQRAVQRVKLLNPIGPELSMLCNIAPRSCP